MVRLLQFSRTIFPHAIPRFNPTMVRLLLDYDVSSEITDEGFNPTMVRLLQEGVLVFGHEQSQFQSHNGAIAAN